MLVPGGGRAQGNVRWGQVAHGRAQLARGCIDGRKSAATREPTSRRFPAWQWPRTAPHWPLVSVCPTRCASLPLPPRRSRRDAAEADTPRTQRRPGSRLVSKDVAAAAKTLDFEDFDDSPPPAGAPRGRGSPAGTPPTRRTAVRSPPSAGARSTSSSGTAAPSGRTSSRSQAAATAVSLSLAGGRGRKAPTARRSAIALPRLDPEGDDAGSADLDEGVLDVGSSAASAKRPRMSGPSEKAIPPRTDGRSWPRGVAPTAEEASADATSSVRDVFATADALTAAVSGRQTHAPCLAPAGRTAFLPGRGQGMSRPTPATTTLAAALRHALLLAPQFQAALPRVNGLAMQNLEAVSTKAVSPASAPRAAPAPLAAWPGERG